MKRLVLLFAAAMFAAAHVGSPDIFLEGSAGPYPMFVTIRPPVVIPGVAEIEIECHTAGVRELKITPMPMVGEASKHPPTADVMKPLKEDPHFFTGALWIMTSGSWQVRIQADGTEGAGTLSVPVPAVASMTKPMQKAVGVGLFVMMIVLALGFVSIVGAGAREGKLAPGVAPDSSARLRARVLMIAMAVFVLFALWEGNRWWGSEAADYARYVYKPLAADLTIEPGDRLRLELKETDWKVRRNLSDFLPDHGHLMHLYVIAEPAAGRVWHLHPEMTSAGVFEQALPAMPAGKYWLFGDVVHRSGFAETVKTELDLPRTIAGNPLQGDDAGGVPGESPDGARIEWQHDATPIVAKKAAQFKFKLVGKDGQPVKDAELYMGMLGHAAFVKKDATVFAHVHPSGSVPMAALMLANPSDHSMMNMDAAALPAEVELPYGFPSPGDYWIIVQMKHAGEVVTNVFNATVH